MNVTVIIPIKGGPTVKSRLHRDPVLRTSLAKAFARDTVAAVMSASNVGRIVVVTGDDNTAACFSTIGCHIVGETPFTVGDRLNTAIIQGRDWAAQRHGDEPLAIVPGDLPTLTSTVLDEVFAQGLHYPMAYCPDTEGSGTTVLMAATPQGLKPAYGVGSAAAHRALGAFALDGIDPRARQDIDTMTDLFTAQRLGIGPATAEVLTRYSTEHAPAI